MSPEARFAICNPPPAVGIALKIESETFIVPALTGTTPQPYAAFACTLSQNSARRSARRSVAGLASAEATSGARLKLLEPGVATVIEVPHAHNSS